MNDVNILFGAEDRVSPKVRTMRREIDGLKSSADKAAGSLQRTGQALGRVGGPIGGTVGRITGGFAGGVAAGIAGGAAALAGVGLSVGFAANDRGVEAARSRADYLLQVRDSRLSAGDQRRSLQAGAASRLSLMRRLTTSYSDDPQGMEGAKADINNIISATGVNADEAAQAVLAARDARVSGTDVARLMASGEFSADEAAAQIRAMGSPERALAMKKRVGLDQARKSLDATAKLDAGSGWKTLEGQLNDLGSGRTKTAADSIESEVLDPEGQAVDKLGRAVASVQYSLEAAAGAEMQCVADLKDLMRVLGLGGGSMKTKAEEYRTATGSP